MRLSPTEQANACYFLRKERQREFAALVAKTDTKLSILQEKWKHLEELFTEEARLYEVARK